MFPDSLEILECVGNKIKHLNNIHSRLVQIDFTCNPLEYDFEPTLENIRNYNKNKKKTLLS